MSRDDHVARARAVYELAASRYAEFVGTEISSATEATVDQRVLVEFTDLVNRGPVLQVADVGCGTGRASAFLAARGLEVVGIDVSHAMVTVARSAHPQIAFTEGRLDALPIGTAVLAGVVSWYSIIYTPPDLLIETFSEFARVLLPGGHLLLGFQAGNGEAVHREDAYGTHLPLTSFRHGVRAIVGYLEAAGLEVRATTQREREPALRHEATPQAFVVARAGRYET